MSAAYFDGTAPAEKRRGGRFTLEGAKCDLGRVLDLSHCGAMVAKKLFKRAPGKDDLTLTVRFNKLHVTLKAKVVREGKIDGVGWVYGIQFLDVTPTQRETLSEIVRHSRPWHALPHDQDQDAA